MPSGAGVTVLRLPLRVTGTQSLCYDSDDNARLACILETDHCQPDLEATTGRVLQADLRHRDCKWPVPRRGPRLVPRNRDCIVLVCVRCSKERRCRPAAVKGQRNCAAARQKPQLTDASALLFSKISRNETGGHPLCAGAMSAGRLRCVRLSKREDSALRMGRQPCLARAASSCLFSNAASSA